jgi:hypothetical protein
MSEMVTIRQIYQLVAYQNDELAAIKVLRNYVDTKDARIAELEAALNKIGAWKKANNVYEEGDYRDMAQTIQSIARAALERGD